MSNLQDAAAITNSAGQVVSGTNSGRREVPRMVKARGGVSYKNITVKAILGEEEQHLPTYVDKIRPTDQVTEEKKNLSSKYLIPNQSTNDSRQPMSAM